MDNPPFDLTANPFHILAVSPSKRRLQILWAYDRAVEDGSRSAAELDWALQALFTPQSRLEAELSWFPGVAPATVDAVMRALGAGDFATCSRALESLSGLPAANLAAHLAGTRAGTASHARRVIEGYLGLDDTVAALIAESRAISGFPQPEPAMLESVTARLRQAHTEAMREWLERQPDPDAVMLELIDNQDSPSPIEGRAAPIDALATGHGHRTTGEDGAAHTEALDYAEQADPALDSIIDVLGANHQHIRDIASDLLAGGFGSAATGQAARLREAFRNALADSRNVQAVWSLLRSALLALNNERSTRPAAVILVEALLAFRPGPPAGMMAKLQQDFVVVRGNVLIHEVEDLARRGVTKTALDKIAAALHLGVSEAQRGALLQIRADLMKSDRRASGGFIWLIGGCLVLIAVVLVWVGFNPGSRPRPAVTLPQAVETPGNSDRTESKPAPGTKSVLQLPELRYCEFQKERLNSVRTMISGALVQRFNAAIDDLNARCGSASFDQRDMDTVTNQRAANKESLAKDGAAMLTGWIQEIAPPPQQPAMAAKPAKPAAPPAKPKPAAPAAAAKPEAKPAPAVKPAAPRVHYDVATRQGAIDVKAELQGRGFYKGKVDGSWDDESKAALKAWKISAGLAPDATWDRATEKILMGE